MTDPRDGALNGDRELMLLAACLRPLSTADRTDAIAHAAQAPFDADRLVELARRHRVAGFVEHGLRAAAVTLPDAAATLLGQRAAASRLQSLRNAGEEIRVGRALAAAGIDALFIKGSTLAMCAHGTLALKTSWDIDVLVAPDRRADAGKVLGGLGYRLSILGGITDPRQIDRYLAAHKEAEWHHDDRGTVVELHTAFSNNQTAIRMVGLTSPRTMVDVIPGAALPTFATAPLFTYLAFHGTTHLWSRMKWLADIAALLIGENVEALHRDAIALGAGRCSGVVIVLAQELLGTTVPPALVADILRDPATRRLLHFSRRAIMAPEDDLGQLMRPMRELVAYARAQAWLVPGFGFRIAAIRSFLTRPYTTTHLQVPPWTVPAVILLALPLRLLRRPTRRRRQAEGKIARTP